MADTGEINFMVGFNQLKVGSAFISISKKPSGSALGAFFVGQKLLKECNPVTVQFLHMKSTAAGIPAVFT